MTSTMPFSLLRESPAKTMRNPIYIGLSQVLMSRQIDASLGPQIRNGVRGFFLIRGKHVHRIENRTCFDPHFVQSPHYLIALVFAAFSQEDVIHPEHLFGPLRLRWENDFVL